MVMIILKDKINTILSISKKNELYIDDFVDVNNKYFYIKEKYKKNFLFKFFFNAWPDKICTSCISGLKTFLSIFIIK